MVSTAGALRLMTDLIVDGEVSDQVANTWLLALNFIPRYLFRLLDKALSVCSDHCRAIRCRKRVTAVLEYSTSPG